MERILEAVHNVLERTPPELGGGYLQQRHRHDGGGSQVDGFDKLINRPHRHPYGGGGGRHLLRGGGVPARVWTLWAICRTER